MVSSAEDTKVRNLHLLYSTKSGSWYVYFRRFSSGVEMVVGFTIFFAEY